MIGFVVAPREIFVRVFNVITDNDVKLHDLKY